MKLAIATVLTLGAGAALAQVALPKMKESPRPAASTLAAPTHADTVIAVPVASAPTAPTALTVAKNPNVRVDPRAAQKAPRAQGPNLSATSDPSRLPAVVSDNGFIAVAWEELANGRAMIQLRVSYDDGVTWTSAFNATDPAVNAYNVSLAIAGRKLYMTWSETKNGGLPYARVVASKGDVFVSPLELGAAETLSTAGSTAWGKVALASDARAGAQVAYAAWGEYKDPAAGNFTWFRRLDSTKRLIGSADPHPPSVAARANRVIVGYQSGLEHRQYTRGGSYSGFKMSPNRGSNFYHGMYTYEQGYANAVVAANNDRYFYAGDAVFPNGNNKDETRPHLGTRINVMKQYQDPGRPGTTAGEYLHHLDHLAWWQPVRFDLPAGHDAWGVRGTPAISPALHTDHAHIAYFEVRSFDARNPRVYEKGVRYLYTDGRSWSASVTNQAKNLGIHSHASAERAPIVTFVDVPASGKPVVMGWYPDRGKFPISDVNIPAHDPVVASTKTGYIVVYKTILDGNEEIAFRRLD